MFITPENQKRIMYEIRLHGRGGQGIKVSAHILGRAAFNAGFEVQDFAVYGAERRGAPVTSFCRFDRKPVLVRGYIFEPDAVVMLDQSLDFDMVIKGLKEDGFILVNSNKSGDEIKKRHGMKQRVYTVDATSVAFECLGRPIPNTAILGALVKLIPDITLKHLERAIKEELTIEGHGDTIKKNLKAARTCYEMLGV